MQARMKNPVLILPEALQALLTLGAATEKSTLPATTAGLAQMRASQLNGCSVCVDASFRKLKKEGETDERLIGVSAWREMPYFTEAERAALALAEALTRLSEQTAGIPDEVWNEAARYYDERELSSLIIAIALENVWNRLNNAVRQIAGTPWE